MFLCAEEKIAEVALKGVENMLLVGQADGEFRGDQRNQYANIVEQCGGVKALQSLRLHEHTHVADKARSMLCTYFVPAAQEHAMSDD